MTTQGENQLLSKIADDVVVIKEGQATILERLDTNVSRTRELEAKVEDQAEEHAKFRLDVATNYVTKSTARWLFAAGCTLAGTIGAVASAVLFAVHP